MWSQSDALCYTRSGDGGVTFGPSIVLATSVLLDPYGPTLSVGRGPNGVVAVLWEDDSLRAIVSTDGGLSFGEAFTVASGAGHGPAVAVGDGVVYVAYTEDVQLLVRRSLDGGSTWTAPDSLGKVVPDTFWGPAFASIAADGANAYIAYDVETQPNSFIRYRQTTNSGQTWSKPVNLSPPSDHRLYSELPVITQQGGTIHVAYGRCNFWFEGACDLGTQWSSELVYRHSNNGIAWSRGETVVDGFPGRVLPVGLGVAGRVMAFYSLEFGGWLVTTRELSLVRYHKCHSNHRRALDPRVDRAKMERPPPARWRSGSFLRGWLARKDSNLQSPDPESGALPFGHSPISSGVYQGGPLRLISPLLRRADFRNFWIGQTISVFGDQITLLADAARRGADPERRSRADGAAHGGRICYRTFSSRSPQACGSTESIADAG